MLIDVYDNITSALILQILIEEIFHSLFVVILDQIFQRRSRFRKRGTRLTQHYIVFTIVETPAYGR